MNVPEPLPQESPSRILFDLAWVAAGTVLCGVLAAHFQWSERVFAWTRSLESLQLDEITFVLLALALGLAWFAARRWRGARRELAARLATQAQLASALTEQQRLGRQFVELQENERRRLSRELHDELGQFINAIKLDAVAIRTTCAQAPPAADGRVAERIRSIIDNTDLVHASVARLVRELRPVGLDELGLAAAVEHCVDTWRPRLAPVQLSLRVDARVDGLDEAHGLTVYRTVQEALTNCARHSRARHVKVDIGWEESPPAALIRIEDDGIGTDPQARAPGLGLAGMRERLLALGGTLSIDSAPGTGFRLLGHLPAGSAGT